DPGSHEAGAPRTGPARGNRRRCGGARRAAGRRGHRPRHHHTGVERPSRMDFDDTPEQRQLRDAVAALGRRYGHEYYVEKAKSGGHTTELWAEAGKLGYLGVSIPTGYG